MDPKEMMENVFSKCEILYNGEVISREHLMVAYNNFLVQSFLKEKHNISFVLHTGSICFDVMAVFFGAISALALNEGEVASVLNSLEEGDMVTYEKGKYVFAGTEEKQFSSAPIINYAVLKKDNGDTNFVPEKKWYKIRPYLGDSKTTDGRGLRKKNSKRREFITTMFDIKEEEIPGVIESSTVLVMPKQKADDLINNISILNSENGKTYDLLDLVTASYYTEGDEYRYSGNPGKLDPNLKVASKLSVARDLIYQPINNEIQGLMVLESDGANQSRSELEELVRRRSLKYVYASYAISAERGDEMLDEYEDANLFACTREFLLQNSLPVRTFNRFTADLDRQVDIIIDKEVSTIEIEGLCSVEDYWKARNKLKTIKRMELFDENKDNFVIQAMSLLNLFITAPFSLKNLDETISNIGVMNAYDKIIMLEKYANGFSTTLKDNAEIVLSTIRHMYEYLYETSPKENELRTILTNCRGEKTAIIIPKAYYEPILNRVLKNYLGVGNVSFFTPNKFDGTRTFKRIIVLGDYCGKRFNTFKCNSAKEINVLLYDFEKKVFDYKRKKSLNSEKSINVRNSCMVYNDDVPDVNEVDYEAEEMNNTLLEIEEYIESMNSTVIRNYVSSGQREGVDMVNAVMLGTFLEGESILFSKNYRAIVFDEDKGEVRETAVENLDVGDNLIFTKNDGLTKSIVDVIFNNLLDEQLLGESIRTAYEKSIYWKEVLRNYIKAKEMTYEELGKQMSKYGSTKNYATIRSWIHPLSHVVGPNDIESYEHIAQVTQDEKLLSNPEEYCNACKIVRTERTKILKMIAAAIIKMLGGEADTNNRILKTVYDNVENLAFRRQLESLVEIKEEYPVPIGMINSPISV